MNDLAVYINPTPEQSRDDNGIGRVIHAMYAGLPAHGIRLVGTPEQADIVAAHINADGLPRIDVLHSHGLYWTGDPGSGNYASWCHSANQKIIEAARQAYAVTVPSPWVAECWKHDMRISPDVIGHGVDVEFWEPTPNHGNYLLYNKNRSGDVCDPGPAVELARRGFDVITTVVRDSANLPPSLQVIGPQDHAAMKELVQGAEIYIATTKETFGIGTLEAMAAGIPVLGYDWGGTAGLVQHQETGYLVQPGDFEGLYQGALWLRKNRDQVGARARKVAANYSWDKVMAKYAALYRRVANEKARERRGVSIVITNFNYGAFVGQAIQSCLDQTMKPDEIIVVDDGSTDNSREIIGPFQGKLRLIAQANQGVAAARNNGIAAATQAHIVCLDADDTLAPTFVETLLPAMQKDRGLGIAYTGLLLTHADGHTTRGDWPPPFDWLQQSNPTNPPGNCVPSASMFRRSMWERAGGYLQCWAPGEDAEFWTRGLSVGFRAARITDEPLFRYRMHAGSASRTKVYRRVDDWHPWMRDHHWPMGAPSKTAPLVRSYSEPLISVVIPVGPGHARLLPAALDSLLGQTFRNWEVIVVDDSATDTEQDMWRRIAQVYPFARMQYSWLQRGASAARNLGLATARGPLVVFLDADDYLMPGALEAMLRAFVASGGERYIYTDWIAINGDKAKADEAPEYDQLLWTERGLHAVTTLLPTEAAREVGGFDETIAGWEDWDFYLKLAAIGMCGQRLAEPLLGYRQHTGQRREYSLARKDELLDLLRERFGDYATGGKQMAGCGSCGSSGAAIIAARAGLMGDMPAPVQEQEQSAPAPNVARLKFIGLEQGSITFEGLGGRRYRGGLLNHAYADVDPTDVPKLLATERWQVVSMPTAPVELPPEIAKPTTSEHPVETLPAPATLEEAELERQANAAAMEFRRQQQQRGLAGIVK